MTDRSAQDAVARSGLFDRNFYLRRYPDVAVAGIEPIEHFIAYGIGEDRWPNPLFDPTTYAAECAAQGLLRPADPLGHFITIGWSVPVRPHAWFDPVFYLARYPDVARASINPLAHYLHYGAAEARQPCAEFVPAEYLRWVPEIAGTGINPLLHALAFNQQPLGDPGCAARFQAERPLREGLRLHIDRLWLDDGLSVSGWLFHETLKVGTVTVVAGPHRLPCRVGQNRSDVHAIFGGDASRDSGFSAAGLALPAAARLSLEVSFGTGARLTIDLAELRPRGTSWTVQRLHEACPAVLEIEADLRAGSPWADLPFVRSRALGDVLAVVGPDPAPLPRLTEPVVILVSVYRGRHFLRPFFDALFRNTTAPYHAVIVDNGNDDPGIVQYLRAIAAARDNVTLVRVDDNRGYVGAMCLAITHAPPGHVVVLNTDTTLPPAWLERLIAPILADPTVGSVTPFTNAGTACSFPRVDHDNALAQGLSADEIDAALSCVRATGWAIDLPSGVGFCMAHSRRAIEQVGWYDHAAFGRGYGEENDWCLRAAAQGFRNVLAPNLFVYHAHGGIYPSAEKRDLLAASLAIVNRRFPHYQTQVQRYFAIDPAAPIRALVAFRLAAQRAPHRVALVIDHATGGGANLYREELVAHLSGQGIPVVLVTCRELDDALDVTLHGPDGDHRYLACPWDDVERLLALVGGVGRIHLNQLVGYADPAAMTDHIVALARRDQAGLTVYVHDFFMLCPSVTLVDADGGFCDLPSPEICIACALRNPDFRLDRAAREGFSILAWRDALGRAVKGADQIVCFSGNSASLIRRGFEISADRIVIAPHFLPREISRQPPPLAGQPLHIGIIGGISRAKGSEIVTGLARAIGDRAIRLTVLGTIAADLEGLPVEVTGRYDRDALGDEIAWRGINLVLLPSIWPETFCFVAEEVMALGLKLAVFDLGAPAERVALYPHGRVLPRCDGAALLDALAAFHAA